MRETNVPVHRRACVLLALLLLCGLQLGGCRREAPQGFDGGVTRTEAARQPAEAVLLLRDRLLAHDAVGFAQLAVPPAQHARLVEAWAQGRSRWPLDELPLDGRVLRMLAALQLPHADKALLQVFKRQFADADPDIDQAVRTLVVFADEYVQKDPGYTVEERAHIHQALLALGTWAQAAPLSDPQRARGFFTALTAAATRTGIDAKRGAPALAELGMLQSLRRLSPFLATLLAQLRQQYGLDVDAALRSLQVRTLQQAGEHAKLELHYRFAGRQITAVVPVVRIDGHWYLARYVHRAGLLRPALASHRAVPATGG